MLLGDRFVLEHEIGSGGMARVFLGRDTVLDRPVAVKVLNPGHDETDIGARFRREGRTAARLSHPNIVQVFDAGQGNLDGKNVSYIVMEYVPGGDLKGLIDKRGTLPDDDLARLGAGAAAGLAHAHERGVVHRDVKPHNVLIDAYGEPKLTDFGIARALDSTTSHATKTGSYLGTALYSAPEQLQGLRVTPKSDVYALGVTLYQAAAGEVPFVGTPIEVAGQHIHKPPVPPRDSDGGRLGDLILDCLAKDPDLRPTAEDVQRRLNEEANRVRERTVPPPPPVVPPAPEPRPTRQAPRSAPTTASAPAMSSQRRRRRPLLLGLAALLLTLLGIASYSAFGGNGDSETASSPPENAQEPAPANNAQPDPLPAENPEPAAEPTAESEQPQEQQVRQPQAAPRQEEEQQAPQVEEPSEGGQADTGADEADGLTEEAAVQTVVDHYNVASSEDYAEAWTFLSSRYQLQLGAQANWTEQFATLQSVEYTSGPVATLTGSSTAEVSFSTRATHTDRVDIVPAATMSLVQEDGRWKIDGLSA